MSGFKDDLDEIDEDFDSENSDEDFGDDDGLDDEGKPTSKKAKSESSGFNRDNYYIYKDKLVQLSGTIKPRERSKEGKVISLDFKTDDKLYSIVMDEMGKKLVSSCFQEFLVTGLVSKVTEKEYTISIKTYI